MFNDPNQGVDPREALMALLSRAYGPQAGGAFNPGVQQAGVVTPAASAGMDNSGDAGFQRGYSNRNTNHPADPFAGLAKRIAGSRPHSMIPGFHGFGDGNQLQMLLQMLRDRLGGQGAGVTGSNQFPALGMVR